MRLSVVINTYNRGPSLRRTLQALRYQTHDAFEVVVVNGPSTDDTAAVLSEFAGALRVGDCPEVHLSKSRNVGIGLASGEVVTFIDDDAIPEPTWLEQLATAYSDERVGGAGGIVYDHTGFRLQYRYAACDRLGGARFDVAPPFDALSRPGADPFVYLQGTNCSFRRRCLVEIGGFDEEIEYFLDEVEVCLQVLDRGYELRPLSDAAVHHKYLASHLRTPHRVVLNPYPFAKNRSYFAYRHGLRTRSPRAVQRTLDAYADDLRRHCETHFAAGRLDAGQRAEFLALLERGLGDGHSRGLAGTRRGRVLPPAEPDAFLHFPALRPTGARLRACVLGEGGPAVELAAAGHEVHVLTWSPDSSRVDFEDGLWRHRLANPERWLPELAGLAAAPALARAAAAYREARRLRERGPLDLLAAPPTDCSALLWALDPERFPTVQTVPAAPAEQQLSLPLEAEEPTRFYRAVAARYAQGPAQAADPVARRLAGVLVEVTGLSPEAAKRAATRLLDPDCYPVDRLAVVLRLLQAPDEDFLTELYRLLLDREPDREGLGNHRARLRDGMPRQALVRNLARSDEARRAGLPLGWLDALGRSPWHRHVPRRAWGLVKRFVRAALGRRGPSKEGKQMSRLARLGGLLRAAVSPKRAARYLKRLLCLPWNFQKLFDDFPNLQAEVRQQAECQRRTEQALVAFVWQLQERQAALEQRTDETLRALTAELREAAARMQQEMRQVKNRYAEFYGALVEGLKEQNRFTEEIARSLGERRGPEVQGTEDDPATPTDRAA